MAKPWGKQDETDGLTGEDRTLLAYYKVPNMTLSDIATKMGRTERSIANRLQYIRHIMGERGEEAPGRINKRIKGSGIKIEEKGNHLFLESKSRRIKNLEDLIEVCEVDLTIWHVKNHKINTWEVGAKAENKDLTYVDGKVSGTIRSEGLTIETLHQVTAWLIRQEPIAIKPVLQSVYFKLGKYAYPRPVKPKNLKRTLVLPDPQFGFYKSLRTSRLTPFHDRAALDVALQIAQSYHIDQTIFLGDLLDLADWSDRFIRSPNMQYTTQPAAIEAKWWISQFVQATDGKKVSIIEGNHDKRMNDAILKHLEEAFELRSLDGLDLPPLLSVPRLLALHDIGVEWVGDYPNGQVWIGDNLVVEHGDVARGKSGATVSSMVQDAHHSKIVGHIHRIEMAFKTIHKKGGSDTIEVWSIGCLCRIDGAVPAKKKRNNWQQAFAIVESFDGGVFNIEPVTIKNGMSIYRGEVFKARDRLSDLRKTTVGKSKWNW
ncbi:hypothetical protein LCGC14_1640610 [marine sediment metagenome]|uniref:Calcineurin-like phosphoesterase domain-containing protein n=1 Tax=marine sediment metagenome TaxID=412755 RepID=A0A0F9KFJ9_9ZZZZ